MKFSFLSAIKRYKLEGGYCMVEHVNSLASELASTTANERSKLDQCKDLLSMLTHMELRLYLWGISSIPKSEPYLGGASLICLCSLGGLLFLFVVVSVGHLKYLFAAMAVSKSEPYLGGASLICLCSLGNLLFLSSCLQPRQANKLIVQCRFAPALEQCISIYSINYDGAS
ncbi:hypothetical protein Tco_1091188 [Tanacetum coccineum]|uniref:Uncharacterized protein n=1 Tax=Tanacetum coccineum TaxID=301880 RepID=A0ABQ5I7N6_9ASTR